MHFVIFSYNRGQFLENCVASVERCAPWAQLTIVDDDSTDPETRKALSKLASRYSVLGASRTASRRKHGGLYGNMQMALEQLDPDDIWCAIQDDMQVVRPVSREEGAEIARYFDDVDDAGFLQPAFMKGCNRESVTRSIRLDTQSDGYQIDRLSSSAGAYYSDVHLARVGSLRGVDWQFQRRESLNEEQARGVFRQQVFLKNPFVAWLPNPPAWRGRRRTFGLRAAQRQGRTGFFPYRELSAEESAKFCTRDREQLPFAEDFLDATGDGAPEKPWRYHPLQGRRLLKLMDSAELKLRRWLPGDS